MIAAKPLLNLSTTQLYPYVIYHIIPKTSVQTKPDLGHQLEIPNAYHC